MLKEFKFQCLDTQSVGADNASSSKPGSSLRDAAAEELRTQRLYKLQTNYVNFRDNADMQQDTDSKEGQDGVTLHFMPFARKVIRSHSPDHDLTTS